MLHESSPTSGQQVQPEVEQPPATNSTAPTPYQGGGATPGDTPKAPMAQLPHSAQFVQSATEDYASGEDNPTGYDSPKRTSGGEDDSPDGTPWLVRHLRSHGGGAPMAGVLHLTP